MAPLNPSHNSTRFRHSHGVCHLLIRLGQAGETKGSFEELGAALDVLKLPCFQ